MIHTFTFHPAMDYYLYKDAIVPYKTNHFNRFRMVPGGKGINVSMVLQTIGEKSVAHAFVGGFIGKEIEFILQNQYHIDTDFIQVESPTRVNVKLIESKGETELNQTPVPIKKEEFEQLLSSISSLTSRDFCICSGTSSSEVSLYKGIASFCSKKEIPFAIDTAGKDLFDTLPYHPFLIKPNIDELETIFETKITTLEDIVKYAKKLIELGAINVIISRGEKGSVFVNKDVAYQHKGLGGKVESTVGAGDSMVAGFVFTSLKTKDIFASYKVAVACGNATAFSPYLLTKKMFEETLPKIIIEKIEV